MAFAPDNLDMGMAAGNLLSDLGARISRLFQHQDFSTESPFEKTPNIDPFFIPRAPMNHDNLDIYLLAELGRMGMKRGKEITPHSHPELMQAWGKLCARAGIQGNPQLILVESKEPNAGIIPGHNAGFITTGLLQHLNFREVVAVLGHEAGHKKSDHTTPRLTAIAVFAGGGVVIGDSLAHRGGVGSMIPYEKMSEGYFKKAVHWMFGSEKKPLSMLGYVAYALAGGWVGSIVANQASVRPTELDADKKGAAISGDPEGLAMALAKLEDTRGEKSARQWFRFIKSGYPTTETRIARLRAMPQGADPIYATIEPAAKTTTPSATTPAAEAAIASPTAQISQITQAARVGAAEPAVVSAI